jgi:hypothetical protein
MKQKTGGVAVLCILLLMSACGKNPVIDGGNIREREEAAAGKASEQEEGGGYITAEGKDGSANSTTPPVQEPGQEIRSMEPFDIDVFNAQKAAWEKDPIEAFIFTQTHSGPGMNISATIQEVFDSPSILSDKNKNEPEPVLFCSTISELYEKIAALWTEQRYTADSFLIKYDSEPVIGMPFSYHYPTDIQIKNIDNSGGDYNVRIHIDTILITIGGPANFEDWADWKPHAAEAVN